MDQIRRCPQCGNPLFEDKQKSLTQCKNKNCGIIIERELITYDQEVNLHENDDQSKKVTRFGGYESKTEAFKNKLAEMIMEKSNDKDRKALSKKFEEGEILIIKLAKKFRMNEQFTASAQAKYRELLFQKIQDRVFQQLEKHKFTAVGAIAFILAIEEAKRKDPDNRKLNKITVELISQHSNLSADKIKRMSDTLMLKTSKDQYSKEDHIQALVNKSKDFDFNDEEKLIMRSFLFNLLDSHLLKGEKSPTINAVILYCVAQLSENPELNIITLDKFAAANDVTKDTVKKLWNQVVNGLITQQIVPNWTGRKPLIDLRTMN